MTDTATRRRRRRSAHACRAFDPAQIAAIARRDATALARTLAVQHRQGLDLFNFALPVRVVAQLIGLPEDMAGQCAALVGDFVRCLSPLSSPDEIAQSNRAAESLLQLLRDEWRRSGHGGLAAHVERLRDLGLDDQRCGAGQPRRLHVADLRSDRAG